MSIFYCAIVNGHLDTRSSDTEKGIFDQTKRLLLGLLNFLHDIVKKS
jgi:hypothetical protein